MTKRIKILVLRLRVKRLERIYRRNPTLRNLHKWSVCCGMLYKMKYLPLTTSKAHETILKGIRSDPSILSIPDHKPNWSEYNDE